MAMRSLRRRDLTAQYTPDFSELTVLVIGRLTIGGAGLSPFCKRLNHNSLI